MVKVWRGWWWLGGFERIVDVVKIFKEISLGSTRGPFFSTPNFWGPSSALEVSYFVLRSMYRTKESVPRLFMIESHENEGRGVIRPPSSWR